MSVESTISSLHRLRYIRLNPRFDRGESLGLLKSEIIQSQTATNNKEYPLQVPWLNNTEHQLEFFAIPGEFSLNKSQSFQNGRVYGMDVTSGAAVAALLFGDLFDSDKKVASSATNQETQQKMQQQNNLESPLRVLDLCCAPGLKLCMMADLVPASSTLVGVDLSRQRISLCKNIVKKYHIDEDTSSQKSIATKQKAINIEGKSTNAHSVADDEPSRPTIRLYCADGTTFGRLCSKSSANSIVFDSNAAREESKSRGKRKRMNKSARAREKRRLLEVQRKEEESTTTAHVAVDTRALSKSKPSAGEPTTSGRNHDNSRKDVCGGGMLSMPAFDRVLVDAECSTDGAIRHIEKREASARTPTWDDSNMDELVDLQKRLIESGFRLLKHGGTMVYSTCSLSSRQNEQVVQWLLDKCNDAFIIPVSFSGHDDPPLSSVGSLAFIEEGSVHGSVRFNPLVGATAQVDCLLPGTGFFLAKIGKR